MSPAVQVQEVLGDGIQNLLRLWSRQRPDPLGIIFILNFHWLIQSNHLLLKICQEGCQFPLFFSLYLPCSMFTHPVLSFERLPDPFTLMCGLFPRAFGLTFLAAHLSVPRGVFSWKECHFHSNIPPLTHSFASDCAVAYMYWGSSHQYVCAEWMSVR